MSHKATLKIDLAIGNYKLAVQPPDTMVDAYMPLKLDVPADRQEHILEVDAGSQRRIHTLVISADSYEENCPKKGPSLQFKFLKWKDAASRSDLESMTDWFDLSGPLFYSGLTLAMLPSTIDGLSFRNMMGRPVSIDVLVAKKGCKREEPAQPSQQQQAKAS